MSEVPSPRKRRLLANFNCKPVFQHIRHGSRMSIAPCGMWALQSVLDDMLRRILLLSINSNRVVTRRYAFGQEPPPPYPFLALHRPPGDQLPAPAQWKRRKPAVRHYGLLLKHSAPIFQSHDAFGFISQEGRFWVPPAMRENADVDYADDDVFGDLELAQAEVDHFSEMEADRMPGVAVEAIRFVPIPEECDSVEDEESASGWFWENESGDLERYHMVEQAQLEASWQLYQADNSLFQHPLIIAAHPDNRYIVDFQDNVQVNVDSQNARSILRQGRDDVSLQELFTSLNEADRVSGHVVRLLSRFDEPSEMCTAKWHEISPLSDTLTIRHETVDVIFCTHSVVFKEAASNWEFDVCVVSSSELKDMPGIAADASGLNELMRDVRLKFGRDLLLPVSCELSPPVPLPGMSPSSVASVVGAASASAVFDVPRNIDEMSEEEQMALALAMSSASQNVDSANADASSAEGIGSLLAVAADSESGDQVASIQVSLPPLSQSEASPVNQEAMPQEFEGGAARESGICCHLKFSVPFDVCASLPSASVEVKLCVFNLTAMLGSLEFEPDVGEAVGRPAPLDDCSSSTIFESFRMLDDNGEFSDEQVDLSSMPAFVGRNSFLDHAMVDHAVKSILSQELLVHCAAEMKAALNAFDLRCTSSSEPYLDQLRLACRSLCFHPESIAFHGQRLTGLMLTERAAISAAAALEYIAAELLELGSKNSDLHRRPVLTAKDICLAIRQDSELQQCFGGFEIGAGCRVNAHNVISDQEFQLTE